MERNRQAIDQPQERTTTAFDKQELDHLLKPTKTNAEGNPDAESPVDSFGAYLKRVGRFPLLTAEQEILIAQAYQIETKAEEKATEELLNKLDGKQRAVATALLARDIKGEREHKTDEDVAKVVTKSGFDGNPKRIAEIEEEIVDKLTKFCTPQQLSGQKEKNRLISPIDAIFQAKRKEARDEVSPLKEFRKSGSDFQATIDPKLQEKFDFALSESDSARDLMMNCNLRLVINIATKLKRESLTADDKIQAAWFGLKRAVEKFDYTKGYKFSTYATTWIRQSVFRTIAETDNLIRLPVKTVEDIVSAKRAVTTMANTLDRNPTREELVAYLSTHKKLDEARAIQIVDFYTSRKYDVHSLNEPLENGNNELGDILPDRNHNLEDDIIADGTQTTIRQTLSAILNETEIDILMRTLAREPMAEIEQMHGLPGDDIRKIASAAKQKLKKNRTIRQLWEEHLASTIPHQSGEQTDQQSRVTAKEDQVSKQARAYPTEPAIQVYSIDRPPTPDKTRKSQQEKDMDAISGIFTKAEAEGGKEAVMKLLKKLPQRERRAIMSRLGLDGKGTKTQAQTAKATGIYWPYERRVLNILTQPEEPKPAEPSTPPLSGEKTPKKPGKKTHFSHIQELFAEVTEAEKGIFLNMLTDKERTILQARMGDGEEKSQPQAAKDTGIPKRDFSKYEAKILKKLKKYRDFLEQREKAREDETADNSELNMKQKPWLESFFEDKSADQIRAAMKGRSKKRQEIVELRLGLDQEGTIRSQSEVAKILGVKTGTITSTESQLAKVLTPSQDKEKPKKKTYFAQIQDILAEATEEEKEILVNSLTGHQRMIFEARMRDGNTVISQVEAAKATGVPESSFSKYEKEILIKFKKSRKKMSLLKQPQKPPFFLN